MAGGHLGFHKEQLEEFTPDIYGEEVKKIITVVQKYRRKIQRKKYLSSWQEAFMTMPIMREHFLLEQTGCRLRPDL